MRCLNCSEKTRQATCGLCSCCAPYMLAVSAGSSDPMTADMHKKLKAAIFPKHAPLRGLTPRSFGRAPTRQGAR